MNETNGSTPRSEVVAAVDANAAAAGCGWRVQLSFPARQRIIYRIMEIISRYLLVSVPLGFDELRKNVVRFEDKMYSTATSQDDYLKKISLKLISIGAKSRQAPAGNTGVPNISHVYRILRYQDHEMEGKNGSTPRSEAAVDWRAQLSPEARQRIANKILATLIRHLPVSVLEGFDELRKIAVRFEEKMYDEATSQGDYLKKISLEMLSLESKSWQAPEIPLYPDHDLTSKLQNLNLESKIEEDQKH